MRELATRKPSLRKDPPVQDSLYLSSGFNFQSKAKSVNKVIGEAELKLISIGDYSDILFKTGTKEEVAEDLSKPFSTFELALDVPTYIRLVAFRMGRIDDGPI